MVLTDRWKKTDADDPTLTFLFNKCRLAFLRSAVLALRCERFFSVSFKRDVPDILSFDRRLLLWAFAVKIIIISIIRTRGRHLI